MQSYPVILWLVFVSLLRSIEDVSGSNRFPDSFRVEVKINRFENPGSVDKDNHYCDTGKACDTSISAFIDLETSGKPFTSAAGQSPTLFNSTDTDSPTIKKVLGKDICGAGVHMVTLRALVYDADEGYQRTVIDEFDCRFHVNTTMIGEDAKSTNWTKVIGCRARYRRSDHRLFARIRLYKTSDAKCILGNDGNTTIPQAWIRQKNVMEFQSASFQPDQYPALRLEFQPRNLNIPKGVNSTKQPCGANNASCHPLLVVKFDTENAMSSAAWRENDPKFSVLAKYTATNAPVIDDVLVHDICGGELDWINLRVIVKNAPAWYEAKLKWHEYQTIEEFDCPTRFVYWLAGTSNSTAAWGPVHDCFPRHPSGIKLGYRIRAYPITVEQCQPRDRLGQEARDLHSHL